MSRLSKRFGGQALDFVIELLLVFRICVGMSQAQKILSPRRRYRRGSPADQALPPCPEPGLGAWFS